MKQKLITDAVQGMLPYLNNAQAEKLQMIMQCALFNYDVTENENRDSSTDQNLVEVFLAAKRIEGCSEKSLKYYQSTIQSMLNDVGKGVKYIVTAENFDARTKIHLQNYLSSRTDQNSALFVSLKAPHERLEIGGIEVRLREMGKKLDIHKVHPHKFRRTLATMAIDKGMPVEQLQRLLGHQKIDTTMQYAMVKQSNVKNAHRKYIG